MKVIKSNSKLYDFSCCQSNCQGNTLKARIINNFKTSDKKNMSEDKSEGNKSKDTKPQEIKTQEVKVRSNKPEGYDEQGHYKGPEGITMKVTGVKPVVTLGSLFNKYAKKSDFSKSDDIRSRANAAFDELDNMKTLKAKVRHSPTDPQFNAKSTLAAKPNNGSGSKKPSYDKGCVADVKKQFPDIDHFTAVSACS